MACEKLPTRFEMWDEWRKSHRGPWLYEILVLLGVVGSPTFEFYQQRYHWKRAEVVGKVGTVYEAYIDDGEEWKSLVIRLGKEE